MDGTRQGEGRVRLVETDDPDTLCEALYDAMPAPIEVEPISPVGDKRAATRLSISALASSIEPFPLPAGAPYGQVVMNVEACTLCLACVSQCPVGALLDNENKPQVGFREDACLQCGICVSTCPESALALEPRFNPDEAARRVRVLHEEEPFCCVDCGKPFGSPGTVKRILEKLGGKHWMFENPDRARLIQMCDDCRVQVAFKTSDNPFQGGEKPRVRTTDDYLDGPNGKPPKLH
jgi:ferredoxin